MRTVFNKRAGGLARALALAVVAAGMAASGVASATPRPLPFTYTTETLGANELEVEQYVDLTPAMALDADGHPAGYLGTQFQTEFEYGITDRLELGLYVVYVPTPSDYVGVAEMTEKTGAKERLRYVFADPGEWPVDVGVYGEAVEGDTEAELEGKILLQRRLGKLRIDANLWGEYEYDLSGPERDLVANPTLGLTYELTPAVHLGAEGWLRVKFPNITVPSPRPFELGPLGYVGPAVLFNFGKLWWSTGIYARVTDVGRQMNPGEAFGPVWARMVLGFEL
ncbi:MAG: hypothetical protein ACRENE_35390 [Polyangiaceae bacterium]